MSASLVEHYAIWRSAAIRHRSPYPTFGGFIGAGSRHETRKVANQ
jgi:hypothetical protein